MATTQGASGLGVGDADGNAELAKSVLIRVGCEATQESWVGQLKHQNRL